MNSDPDLHTLHVVATFTMSLPTHLKVDMQGQGVESLDLGTVWVVVTITRDLPNHRV